MNDKTENVSSNTKSMKISNEEYKGSYTNTSTINYTSREFVVDHYISFDANMVLVSRLLFSPQHMKEYVNLLNTQLENYENMYGEIEIKEKSRLVKDFL